MSFSVQALSANLAALLPVVAGPARDEALRGNREQGSLLQSLPPPKLIIAFSGGLDSCVLLHAMKHLQSQFPDWSLAAIHINHGLSPNADAWQAFCEKTCNELEIPLQVVRVHIERDAGASLENLARDRRYEAFSKTLEKCDCLLMAHHLDDQAETFLLRTLRGAGPRGLAAMPASRPLGKGVLLRPLLSFSRQALEQWAREQQLDFIDDESNANIQFDRNYCRHEVLPRLAARWPGYRESWLRSAQLSAEADGLLDELAELDFASISTADFHVVRCVGFQPLSEARQRNLLRYWLREAGAGEPGWNLLTRMISEVLAATSDAQPELHWQAEEGAVILRRHGGMLHLLPLCPVPDIAGIYAWNPLDVLPLPDNGTLQAVTSSHGPGRHGLRIVDGQQFTIRYRQGGEECQLAGRPRRALKKVLQEAGMAPWVRARLPLVYADDTLVCIPGIGVCEGWLAQSAEPAWEIVWTPPQLDLST